METESSRVEVKPCTYYSFANSQVFFESLDFVRFYDTVSKHQSCSLRKHIASSNDVLAEIIDPYIFFGNRLKLGWKDSFLSLFKIHNELVNCWTHIAMIPCVLYVLFNQLTESKIYIPFCIYITSVLCFLCGSSFAHTFCCYPLLQKHAFFIIDYVGLSIFSHGSAIAYFAYSIPIEFRAMHGVLGLSLIDTLLIGSCVLSMLAIFQSVWTRTLPPSLFCAVLRVGAFAIPGLYASLPVLYRVYQCSVNLHVYPEGYCLSSEIWPLQFVLCLVAITFYITRFPERLFPGKFDYFGQSHNFFHLFSNFGLYFQYQALLLDIKFADNKVENSPIISLICLSFVLFATVFTCIYYRCFFKMVKKRD